LAVTIFVVPAHLLPPIIPVDDSNARYRRAGRHRWNPRRRSLPEDRSETDCATAHCISAVVPRCAQNIEQAKTFILQDVGIEAQTFWTWQDNTIEIQAHQRAWGLDEAQLALLTAR
jgi:hypothetical protein